MPEYFIPEGRDFTQQRGLNQAKAREWVDRAYETSPHPTKLQFASLIEELAAAKRLCLDEALKDQEFVKALIIFIKENTLPVNHKAVIRVIHEGNFAISSLQAINTAVMALGRPLETKTHSSATPRTPPGSVRAAAAQMKDKVPTHSLLGRLNTVGYWENSETYYPTDVDAALDGYVGVHGPLTVINGTEYTWYSERVGGRDVRVNAEDQTQKLQAAITAAFQNPTTDTVLVPANNGSSHFVLLEIKKIPGGGMHVSLIDSMGEHAHNTSPQHKANNKALLELVERAFLPGKVTSEIKYTNLQGEGAKCPQFALLEVVSRCYELKAAPDDELKAACDLILPQNPRQKGVFKPTPGQLRTFEAAMARKVVKKAMAKNAIEANFNPSLLEVDDLGILSTDRARNDADPISRRYKEHFKTRNHWQFEMTWETHERMYQVCEKLSQHCAGHNDTKSQEIMTWLAHVGVGPPITVAKVIKAVMLNKNALPSLLKDQTTFIQQCKGTQQGKGLITSERAATQDYLMVGGILVKGESLSPEKYILRQAPAEVKIETVPASRNFEPEHKKMILTLEVLTTTRPFDVSEMRSIINREFYEKHIKLMAVDWKLLSNGKIAITFVNNPPSNSSEPLLEDLAKIVYKNPDNIEGVFGQNALHAIQEYKIAEAKAEKKAEKDALVRPRPTTIDPASTVSTIFTVVQPDASARVTGRHQIISDPAAPPPKSPATRATPTSSPRMLDSLQTEALQKKKLENGRSELRGWLMQEELPLPVAGPGKDRTKTSVLDLRQKNQVAIKQYFAADIISQEDTRFLGGRDLTQCGVMETCIEPGKSTQLELILPVKKVLIKEQKRGGYGNFNALVFDFIHRAVQETLAEQDRVKPHHAGSPPPMIILDQVTSLHLHLPPTQLALMQYCYMMGYQCQTKHGEVLNGSSLLEVLDRHQMPGTHEDYNLAFRAFIKRPDIINKYAPEEPRLTVDPSLDSSRFPPLST